MSQNQTTLTKIFAPLIFIVIFCFGLIWAAVVPAKNEAPDEASHLNMIDFLQTHQRIPVFNREEDLIPTQYDPSTMSKVYYSMAYISPVSYLPYLLVAKRQLGDISKSRVMPIRIVTVLLLSLAALFMYLSLINIKPNNYQVAAAATLFIFFIPQVIFSSGYINVEPIALLFSTLSLYFLIKIKMSKFAWQNYLCFALSLGLLGLMKPNYYIFILFALLVILFYLKLSASRQVVKYFLVSGAAFLLINFWWWVRNIIFYNDPLIISYIKNQIIDKAPEKVDTLAGQGYNLATIFIKYDFVKFSAGGFFANLGGANIFLPTYFYAIFYGILVYILILAVKNRQQTKLFLWPFVITSIAAIIYFAHKNLFDYSPQGRHLFPLMIPLGVIVYLALSTLKPFWQKIAGVFMMVFVLFSSFYGLWLTVDGYYIKGSAYINKSNFGSILPGFGWRNFSFQNYQKLFNYIFNGNPAVLGTEVIIIATLIMFLALTAILYLITKNSSSINQGGKREL